MAGRVTTCLDVGVCVEAETTAPTLSAAEIRSLKVWVDSVGADGGGVASPSFSSAAAFFLPTFFLPAFSRTLVGKNPLPRILAIASSEEAACVAPLGSSPSSSRF